jgi:hypothetical protein
MPFRRPDGHDLDAQGAQAHRVLHGALHGAAEHDALLELLRDAVGDQLGIDFGLAHFLDVDGHRHAQLLAEFALEVSRCPRPSCRSPRPDVPRRW